MIGPEPAVTATNGSKALIVKKKSAKPATIKDPTVTRYGTTPARDLVSSSKVPVPAATDFMFGPALAPPTGATIAPEGGEQHQNGFAQDETMSMGMASVHSAYASRAGNLSRTASKVSMGQIPRDDGLVVTTGPVNLFEFSGQVEPSEEVLAPIIASLALTKAEAGGTVDGAVVTARKANLADKKIPDPVKSRYSTPAVRSALADAPNVIIPSAPNYVYGPTLSPVAPRGTAKSKAAPRTDESDLNIIAGLVEKGERTGASYALPPMADDPSAAFGRHQQSSSNNGSLSRSASTTSHRNIQSHASIASWARGTPGPYGTPTPTDQVRDSGIKTVPATDYAIGPV